MTTQLRTGYTTGACAAAAAKASAIGLLTGTIPDTVEIDTPIGKVLKLTILEKSIGSGFAKCAVKKDAGDDPDVTHGCRVFARVERTECGMQNAECGVSNEKYSDFNPESRIPNSAIKIEGGEGIGTVTKPGLQIPPGEPAINPVPRRMITEALSECGLRSVECGVSKGKYSDLNSAIHNPQSAIVSDWKVTISVPGGEEIAKETFNPRLGIIGGISIIGTTGIVKPMSEAAIKASLVLSLDVAKALGLDSIVLAPGNIGEKAILQWVGARHVVPLQREQVILMSNYVGFMLLETAKRGFKKVILAGHPGKLAKLIRGDFYTHSSKSKSANDLILECIDHVNANMQRHGRCTPHEKTYAASVLKETANSPTVEGIAEILKKHGSLSVFNTVANRIEDAALRYVGAGFKSVPARLKIGTILFNMNCEPIGISKGAQAWQKGFQRGLQ